MIIELEHIFSFSVGCSIVRKFVPATNVVELSVPMTRPSRQSTPTIAVIHGLVLKDAVYAHFGESLINCRYQRRKTLCPNKIRRSADEILCRLGQRPQSSCPRY